MFITCIALIMAKVENIMDAMGMDGRQATLLIMSSKQEGDTASCHGRVIIPLNIK
jgi:hypothetical protein